MIGTVVVPLDGSELAERAIVYARAIVERTEAPMLLVRVVKAGADEQATNRSRDYLREISHSIPGRVQIEVAHGRPGEGIAEIAEQVIDPMIVMSTHGRGGLQRWLTGSVADEVVRTAGVPVLLVRPTHELPESLDVRDILLPLDGSAYSEPACAYAREIAKLFGSRIHLVRIVDAPSAYAMLSRHMEASTAGNVLDEIIRSMTREATEYVDRIAAELEGDGIAVTKAVLDGYPGEELLEYERRGNFQLVVIATAGRSGAGKIVFGSVAERMLKLGRSPVMMVRPRPIEAAELPE